MPRFAQYNVWLLDHTGTKLRTLLPGADFRSIAWQHKINDAGVYRLELVAETDTKDAFVVDYQVLIERNATGDGEDWYDEYVGFHLDEEEWYASGDVDEHYWASLGLSPEWLLNQPLLQPVRNLNNSLFAVYDLWWKHGYADDVIKLMVAESMTASPDADRNYAYVTVEGYTSQGAFGCYEGAYVRLIDAIRDTVGEDGSRGLCDFAMVRVDGGYQFRTYAPFRGTDRRLGNVYGNKPVIFSFQHENMLNPHLKVLRHGEVTAAYGGWQGAGMERTVYPLGEMGGRMNAAALAESPYRRREGFYDMRDVSQPDQINAVLDQKLIDDGKKDLLTFKPIQTNACLYGRDWQLGDLCTAEAFDRTWDVRITEVNGRIDGDSEETIEGVAELWTRAEVA